MTNDRRINCCDCDEGLSRREFVKNLVGVAPAGGLAPLAATPARAFAAPSPKSPAETTVKRFYDSLNKEQRAVICFPFDHELRKRINANWAITKPSIEELLTTGALP